MYEKKNEQKNTGSSGQNVFFPLVEEQASHIFEIHTDGTQEIFWSSGETCSLPSLPESPVLFQGGSNAGLKSLLSEF